MNLRTSSFVASLLFAASLIGGETAAALTLGQRVQAEATNIRETLKKTEYSHKTVVDEKAGSYAVDCSGFVCLLLKKWAPKHYKDIPKGTHARPLAVDFYEHFAKSPSKPENGARWQRVERIEDAKPGDLIAWRREELTPGENTGHIVIVAETPGKEADGQFRVVVLDSTATHHGNDSRKEGETGIGRGTMWFTTDAEGKPTAYRWRSIKGTLREEPISIGRLLDE